MPAALTVAVARRGPPPTAPAIAMAAPATTAPTGARADFRRVEPPHWPTPSETQGHRTTGVRGAGRHRTVVWRRRLGFCVEPRLPATGSPFQGESV